MKLLAGGGRTPFLTKLRAPPGRHKKKYFLTLPNNLGWILECGPWLAGACPYRNNTYEVEEKCKLIYMLVLLNGATS